jgi:hypothetical protein
MMPRTIRAGQQGVNKAPIYFLPFACDFSLFRIVFDALIKKLIIASSRIWLPESSHYSKIYQIQGGLEE